MPNLTFTTPDVVQALADLAVARGLVRRNELQNAYLNFAAPNIEQASGERKIDLANNATFTLILPTRS
jgi:hypothetical protein